MLKIGPAGLEYSLTHWNGSAFTFRPSSENQTDGSISLATFNAGRPNRLRSLTVEYLDEGGMGTFIRK